MTHREFIKLPRLSGSRQAIDEVIDSNVGSMRGAILEVDASEMAAASISTWQQIFRRAFVLGDAESVIIVKPTPYAARRIPNVLMPPFADKVSIIERVVQ